MGSLISQTRTGKFSTGWLGRHHFVRPCRKPLRSSPRLLERRLIRSRNGTHPTCTSTCIILMISAHLGLSVCADQVTSYLCAPSSSIPRHCDPRALVLVLFFFFASTLVWEYISIFFVNFELCPNKFQLPGGRSVLIRTFWVRAVNSVSGHFFPSRGVTFPPIFGGPPVSNSWHRSGGCGPRHLVSVRFHPSIPFVMIVRYPRGVASGVGKRCAMERIAGHGFYGGLHAGLYLLVLKDFRLKCWLWTGQFNNICTDIHFRDS